MSDDYDWTPHLQEGEELLWQGRPDQRTIIWSLADILTMFSIAFTAFIFSSVFSADTSIPVGPINVNPLGVFFIAVVIAFLVQRFFRDAMVRRRTHYAVTSRRALVIDQSRKYLAAQMHLSPELTIFSTGRWYQVVVFTQVSRQIWGWRTGMVLDGPPLRRHPMAGPEAIFLGLANAIEVEALATTAAKARL